MDAVLRPDHSKTFVHLAMSSSRRAATGMIMDTKRAVDSGASSKWIISSSGRKFVTLRDRINRGGIEYTSMDGRSSIT
mgnify:CR=1 FL=1